MIIRLCMGVKIGEINVVTQLMYWGFTALPRNTNVKCAINNMVIIQVSVTRRTTKLTTIAD